MEEPEALHQRCRSLRDKEQTCSKWSTARELQVQNTTDEIRAEQRKPHRTFESECRAIKESHARQQLIPRLGIQYVPEQEP
jgi:hypothetical protein